MDITLSTGIGGYFSYKIYRETPDNIIYESPQQKNLIVNSGLKHLYSFSIPEVMRVLDIGNSNEPASPSDTKLKGSTFNNSNIFNDLLALYITGGPIDDEPISEYTAFFRTKTTSSTTILKEFVIKPGVGQDAFARQIFNTLTLQGGDGIEFTYKVRVNWPCKPINSKMKLSYYKGIQGGTDVYTENQLPLIWNSVSSSIDKKVWSDIAAGNNTVVAVASNTLSGDQTNSNIAFSLDSGDTWELASTPESVSYDLSTSFNSIAYAPILNEEGGFTDRYVAVGTGSIFFSETGTLWLSATPPQNNIWTGVAGGSIRPTPGSASTPTFFAVSRNGTNRVIKSTNGSNWSAVTGQAINTPNWSSITYGNNTFVAVADGGTHRIAYLTGSDSPWISAAAPALNEWQDIAYGNGLYVAVSKNATYSPIMYASGGDLSKWFPARSPYPASWRSVTYGDGLFVAVGEADFQPRAIYSRDGINWQPVNSIPSDKIWKSVAFINNTFITVASSNVSTSYSIAKVESAPRANVSLDVDITTSLLSKPDRVFNPNSYMYTLRSFDMPVSCDTNFKVNPEELEYSTTYNYNSYVKSQNVQLPPNAAISTYTFDKLKGHGAIKNLLITNGTVTEDTFSGIWAVDLKADSNLTEPIVYTGAEDSIISLSPELGSLTRNLSSTIGQITNSNFTINVIHTWGENVPNIISSTGGSSLTGTGGSSSRSRPYVDIVIPNFEVLDLDDYPRGEDYKSLVGSESKIALYPEFGFYTNQIVSDCNDPSGTTSPNPNLINSCQIRLQTIFPDQRLSILEKRLISQAGLGNDRGLNPDSSFVPGDGISKWSQYIKNILLDTSSPVRSEFANDIISTKVSTLEIKNQFDAAAQYFNNIPSGVDEITLLKEVVEIPTTNIYARRTTNNTVRGAKIRIYFATDPNIVIPDIVRVTSSAPEEFICDTINGRAIYTTIGIGTDLTYNVVR